MQAVLRAAKARDIAYVGAVEPETVGGAVDWQRFLDLLDEAGGSTTADDLFRRWVVDAADRERLDARATARTAYHGLVVAGGQWLPPAFVRVPMSSWDFPTATARIAQATAVIDKRDELVTVLSTIGLDAPTDLRKAYESATTGMDQAGAIVDGELAAARSLVTPDAAVHAPRDTFVSIGLIGATPDADLAAARSAFESGATDAATRAEAVTALIGGAAELGRNRVTLGVGAVVLIAVLIVAAVVLIRRRRASERRFAVAAGSRGAASPAVTRAPMAHPAGEDAASSYATLPDQPAEADRTPTDRPEERDTEP
jgi:hypothetical protein